MEQNIFSPKLQILQKDTLSGFMRTGAYGILIIVFGLLPVLFIPGVYTSIGFSKSYFVIIGLFLALVLLSLAMLRSGTMRVLVPPTLAFFWGVAAVAVVSGLLSGDVHDALFGNVFEVHTAGFLVLMGLVMTASLVFSGAKAATSRLFIVLGVSALVVQIFHILRLFVGPEFLSFGIFTAATDSLIGSFNDLAIFSGLIIIVSLMFLQHVSQTMLGKIGSVFLVLSSLLLLSVINFYSVWLVVGFVSLLMALYLVSKDTWLRTEERPLENVSRLSLGLVGVVCVVSAAFIMSGNYLGSLTSSMVDISYLEVRPSVSATLDIARQVYGENALFGIGPNRFEDAWREYKSPVINQTVFWNTNFSAGSGYVPTLFIQTGILGGVLFILFFGAFILLGYRMIFVSEIKDLKWQMVGMVSFVSALYLWIMSIVYVPGVTILLLASIMTGLTCAVYTQSRPDTGITIDVTRNRQYGLLLIASVLVLIISSVLSVLTLSKQYLAQVVYADTVRAFQSGAEFAVSDAGLRRSEELDSQDLFVSERAQLRLVEMGRLSTLEATPLTQQSYSTLLTEGIRLAEQAVLLDQTNPSHYILLHNFYRLLDPLQFEGVKERIDALVTQAREYDPMNPTYLVMQAQYAAQNADLAASRTYLVDAVKLKGDYTDALFLLSQLDIQEGKVDDAIAVTRSIISLEPNNPTRYFQLGVLLAAKADMKAAIESFETAILLDTNYANARYFLALSYLDSDRTEEALMQLRIVEESNKDNADLKALIDQVAAGQYVKPSASFNVPVQSNDVVSQEEDVTTATEVTDTDLVTPLNRPVSTEAEQSDVQNEDTSTTTE